MSAIKALILITAFGWLAKMVFDAVSDLRSGELVLDVRPGWLALSALSTLATFFLLVWAWRYIAAELSGTRLPYLTSARIWFISNLGSQLPGRVWGIIQMGAMSTEAGLDPVSAGTAAIINTIVNLATGLAVGVLAGTPILIAALGEYGKFAWILALLAVLGISALPWLMPWIFRVAHWLGVRVPEQRVPARVILVSAAINAVGWGMYGIAFLFLNRGLVNLPAYDLMQHIAVNAASYVVGYMVFFVPAGLGFRESALQRTMVAAHMASQPQAVAVSLVSRLWQLIILILPALIFLAYRRPPNEKNPAAG